MSKYTFTSDFVPDQLDRVNHATRITHEFEAESLDLVLSQFTDFLRGCGYHFEGNVEVVDDLPVKEDVEEKDWTDFHTTTPLSGETTYPFWGKDENRHASINLEVKGKYYVDPPSGWQYGFPAVYDKNRDGTLEEFFRSKGYPEKDMKFALENYRSWINYDGVPGSYHFKDGESPAAS